MRPAPAPEEQLKFLMKIQRLFNEGDFTATYKYALLMSLAELAVEKGTDDGEALLVRHKEIALKFIDLYWQQAAPYFSAQPGTTPEVLVQNNGAQAAIVSAITSFRRAHRSASAANVRLLPSYTALVSDVARTIAAQPIRYIQNLGNQSEQFIFVRHRGAIELLPGVAFCLRRFQPLLSQLARNHWVLHIKRNKLNRACIGDSDDLESFLFETSHKTLVKIGKRLKETVTDRCFYCGSKVAEADVDHFIPFALYPRDLIHNFVLAHPSCNRSKSDTLAAKMHLDHWLEYGEHYSDDLHEIASQEGVAANLTASRAVTEWAYQLAINTEANAWIKAGKYEPVSCGYLRHGAAV
jgi:5-methylcytosine-specific restriction endonuclease McrA